MKQLFSILFLFIALSVSATTYYIDPAGNDATGTGAIGAPWKTLYKACTSVTTSGDIIHVNAGTYDETLMATLSVGVSIEGVGVTSIIRNTRTTNFSTPGSAFQNLLLSSAEGTSGNQHIRYLKFDGQMQNYWGVYVAGRSNVEIDHNTFIDFVDRGIIMGGRNDNSASAPTIYATGNSFHDNIVTNCAQYDQSLGYGAGCLNIGGQNGMLIYNNTITQNSRANGFNGWPIKMYNDGYLKGCRIYKNTLNKIQNSADNGGNNWDFAIELFNEYGLQIDSNNINGGSIDINHTSRTGGYAYGAWIHHNAFTQPTQNTYVQTGVTIEFNADSVIVEYNTFEKISVGVLFTPRAADSVKRVRISNNYFNGIGMDALSQGGSILFNNSSSLYLDKLYIYNNTFLSTVSSPPYWGLFLPKTLTTGFAKNIFIRNNILKGAATAPIAIQGGTLPIDSLFIEYNDLYANGTNNLVLDGGAPTPTHYTFANNKSVNPSFNGNKLVAGTALVDSGINVGLPYLGTAPDINWTDSTAPAPPVNSCVWDSASAGPGLAISGGGLTVTKTSGNNGFIKNAQWISGKKAWEVTINSISSPNWGFAFGIVDSAAVNNVDPGNTTHEYIIIGDGTLYHNGYFSGAYTGSFTTGDVIRGEVDSAAGTFTMFKNGTSLGVAYTGIPAGKWYPMIGGHDFGWTATANFSPTVMSSGYTELCTANISPTAAAGTDQTTSSTTVTLTGSGTDSDGSIASYAWTKTSGTGGTITSPSAATTTVTGLSVGTYVFRLTVTDNLGATGYDEVTITITADGRYIRRAFVNF